MLLAFTREIYSQIELWSQDPGSNENDVDREGVKKDVGDNILGTALNAITLSKRNTIGSEAQLLLPPPNPLHLTYH